MLSTLIFFDPYTTFCYTFLFDSCGLYPLQTFYQFFFNTRFTLAAFKVLGSHLSNGKRNICNGVPSILFVIAITKVISTTMAF